MLVPSENLSWPLAVTVLLVTVTVFALPETVTVVGGMSGIPLSAPDALAQISAEKTDLLASGNIFHLP